MPAIYSCTAESITVYIVDGLSFPGSPFSGLIIDICLEQTKQKSLNHRKYVKYRQIIAFETKKNSEKKMVSLCNLLKFFKTQKTN